MEQIKAMLKAMEKDAAFGEEMRAVGKDGNVGEIIEASAKKGFVFTEADWQEYMDFRNTQSANSECKELTPEELDRVAGGGSTQNRYDPSVCANISGPCIRCYGHLLWDLGMWCDYYRRETIAEDQYRAEIRHICTMGRFVTIETKFYDPSDA